MNLQEVCRHCANCNSAKDFLREKGILRIQIPRCGDCDGLMTEVKYRKELIWRCPSHKSKKLSLRDGSFLQYQNISLQDFIWVVYCWAIQIPVTTTEEMVGLSRATTIKWYSYLRDVCSKRLVTHPVSVDESIMAKRKKKNHKDEFVWRQQYGCTHNDAFENILLHISQWADYWKSQPRKFCEFCKCWLTENKPGFELHEKGKRHQKNVRKKIEKDKTERKKEESGVIVKLGPEEIKKDDNSEVDAVFEGPLPRNADTDHRTRAETCTSRKAYGEWVTYEEEAPVDYELPEVPTKDIPVPDFSKKEPLIVKFKFKDKRVTSLSCSDDVTAVAFKKRKVTMRSRDV